MYICEKCGKSFNEDWREKNSIRRRPEVRFCSRSCANSKIQTKEMNEARRIKLKKDRKVFCIECNKLIFEPRSKQKFCSTKCSSINRCKDKSFIDKMSKIAKKRASSLEERKRLRDIGRKGGFGKKGYTKNGVRFESCLEEKCFNYLDGCSIKYTPHKQLPNSSKVSDLYLDDYNIWIELDGIDREKKKKWLAENYYFWLNKIKEYEEKNLTFFVFKTFEEFKHGISSVE